MPSDATIGDSVARHESMLLTVISDAGSRLFVTGFLVLFLELACIRWFATYVIFLQFFTNVVLLASFLGMSCGCMAARSRREWLSLFPQIAFVTIVSALLLFGFYHTWSGLAIDAGNQVSPQEVFYGTEYRNRDLATFVIPIEAIAGVFFVLIALMFVGPGQALGRALDAYPERIRGYALNISGSIVGIVLFSLLSLLQMPPIVWFLVAFAGVGWLLYRDGRLTPYRLTFLALVCVLIFVYPLVFDSRNASQTRWSPYYSVALSGGNKITVNTIGHQSMERFDKAGSQYSLIHLLRRASGRPPFDEVLIIGAGSGNDVDHALHLGVRHVDAVEIDPVILDIGVHKNPDQPYRDARVDRHLDDGRHFLRTTSRKYDLVTYALVDSLIMHSGYSNIRLESYLFTQQAFDDVRRVLKPGGVFIIYNFFRQGWVVERIVLMTKRAFGCDPAIISLPYRKTLRTSEPTGFTMIISDCTHSLSGDLYRGKPFWLNVVPYKNVGVNGFKIKPTETASPREWLRIAPTALLADTGSPIAADDDWPFPYLRGHLVPALNLRSIALLGGLALALIWAFLPTGARRIDSRMFLLGAGFMLLETRAVVQLALVFGSTWIVNSAVFLTVLVLVLLANVYALRTKSDRVWTFYIALVAAVLIATFVPLTDFLNAGLAMRIVMPCILTLGPMLFASVLFARSFAKTINPDLAFASNIAGSVVGGLAESLSMLVGFRYLLLVALVFYVLSIWSPAIRPLKLRAAN